jgi:hypothetical protein
MRGGGIDTRRLLSRACAIGIPIVCSGALCASASAATLKVSVPARVKQNKSYTIRINGSYKASDLTGKAYLIALIQYSSADCKATAQLENSRVKAQLLQFYFAPAKSPSSVGIFENRSPFRRADKFTARALGARRICAYLYPKLISATAKVQPIATANKKFTVHR